MKINQYLNLKSCTLILCILKDRVNDKIINAIMYQLEISASTYAAERLMN